jgi:hypothetical protein
MSTKAGTIEVTGRPARSTVWAAIVSVVAATALIMSVLAFVRAERTSSREVTIVGTPLWDAGKLDAMQGRAVAEAVWVTRATLWDAGKLDAMQGRGLAG